MCRPGFPIWIYLEPLQARNVAYCNSTPLVSPKCPEDASNFAVFGKGRLGRSGAECTDLSSAFQSEPRKPPVSCRSSCRGGTRRGCLPSLSSDHQLVGNTASARHTMPHVAHNARSGAEPTQHLPTATCHLRRPVVCSLPSRVRLGQGCRWWARCSVFRWSFFNTDRMTNIALRKCLP